jgi:hypothetical protein
MSGKRGWLNRPISSTVFLLRRGGLPPGVCEILPMPRFPVSLMMAGYPFRWLVAHWRGTRLYRNKTGMEHQKGALWGLVGLCLTVLLAVMVGEWVGFSMVGKIPTHSPFWIAVPLGGGALACFVCQFNARRRAAKVAFPAFFESFEENEARLLARSLGRTLPEAKGTARTRRL